MIAFCAGIFLYYFQARYCNQTCQKLHWGTHKKFCESLKEEYLLIQQQKNLDKERENQALQKNEESESNQRVPTHEEIPS